MCSKRVFQIAKEIFFECFLWIFIAIYIIYLLGLNDRAKEYYFQWSSGLPLPPNGYTNWAPGEPDDTSGRENCVEINTRTLYWDDVSCSSYNTYVCEHPLGTFSLKVSFI